MSTVDPNHLPQTSIRYRVKHSTEYQYSEPVPLSQNQVRLTPRNRGGQRLFRRSLRVLPKPERITHRRDYFSNVVSYFDVCRPHDSLTVTLLTEVDVHRTILSPKTVSLAWEKIRSQLEADTSPQGLNRYQFIFASPLVPILPAAAEYALKSFTKGRPILDALLDLNTRIHHDFAYDPNATTVNTPLSEVFRKRRGVCQDLAHVGVGCLRAIGLPARYVSGYVRTYPAPGQPQLIGGDASHAWLSLFTGATGWVDIDPTNNVIVNNDHLSLAIGRDYRDVCPVNGLYIGGGRQTLAVGVHMQVIDTPAHEDYVPPT